LAWRWRWYGAWKVHRHDAGTKVLGDCPPGGGAVDAGIAASRLLAADTRVRAAPDRSFNGTCVHQPTTIGDSNYPAAGGCQHHSRTGKPAAPRYPALDPFLNNITRGSIYDRSGRLLASDQVDADGRTRRIYSEPSLAHTLGYVSGIGTGVAGLEMTYNQSLLGLDRADTTINSALNKPITGSDLILTIDAEIQRAAEQALGGRAGSVVVLDGRSGAVLASASAPRFDPNRILEGGYANEVLQSCGDQAGCQAPFLNRTSQARYSPGSTWKTVALIAALDSGQVTPDTVFDFGEPVTDGSGTYYVYRVDGGIIPDPNHKERQLDLTMSYARSANAAFARIGDEMPPDTLLDYAGRFGFGAPGEYEYLLDIESNPAQLCQQSGRTIHKQPAASSNDGGAGRAAGFTAANGHGAAAGYQRR
jgi:cell division protein FtsI/penicillin-binding protein 2